VENHVAPSLWTARRRGPSRPPAWRRTRPARGAEAPRADTDSGSAGRLNQRPQSWRGDDSELAPVRSQASSE
jgi:hypothetical protein